MTEGINRNVPNISKFYDCKPSRKCPLSETLLNTDSTEHCRFLRVRTTRSLAVSERPRDASCHLAKSLKSPKVIRMTPLFSACISPISIPL